MIIDTGHYRFRVSGAPEYCYSELSRMYGDSVNLSPEKPVDFQLDFTSTSWLRTLVRPQRVLNVDNQRIFNPIAKDKCLPSIEWGMNWCVASYDHTRLLIHSSVLVKNDKAIIFPAAQGSGKSTLATLLGLNGWHLYSDEMAIVDLNSATVSAVHRASSLKNQSIKVVHSQFPNAVFSRTTEGTQKGAIAHVQVHSRAEFDHFGPASVVAVACPKYVGGARTEILPLNQSQGFAQLVRNSFNYSTLGEQGFETLFKLVQGAEFFALRYSNVNEIGDFLETLV
ncbi:HprK-related kinase A [Alteromonas aestuariivivens]|uniref:HprK-related kinase A n=1 Tax=Alteromonas aestuariivivens TaxID=1938339 RepID=A0A3D8MEM0_9ALTE|nr:HprK-related kinase A [Alteromonas aestuariivivens]RDV29213.1 HprK-related kinase A [Alteromonas aestuariivivens]